MIKKFLFLFLVSLVSFSVLSQAQTGIIKGKITDNETGEPLPFTTIVIEELNMGCVSDFDGNFILKNVPVGTHILKVAYISYETIEKEITIQPKQVIELNFVLEPFLFPLSDPIILPEFNLTANRGKRYIFGIPVRVDQIKGEEIGQYPVTNTDDLLRSIASVNVNRSWGIFSKNSSVTMRGMDGSSRVLVLLDGVPLNHSAGGSVNWNIVQPENIERIEVVKGPASALYGNNAMTGVINIITKKSYDKFALNAKILGGNFGTFGSNLRMNGASKNKNLIWVAKGFYRSGDGYYLDKEEDRDSLSAKAFLEEWNTNFSASYAKSKNHKFTVSSTLFGDKRGQGRQVYEEDGDHITKLTSLSHIEHNYYKNNFVLTSKAFFQYDEEYHQSENVSTNSGKYKLNEETQKKSDIGLWVVGSQEFSEYNILTFGSDMKYATVNTENIYRTSTDEYSYEGQLLFNSVFVQDEIKSKNGFYNITVGGRLDIGSFSNGKLIVVNPTTNTGFVLDQDQEFAKSEWMAFSPKVAVKRKLRSNLSTYLSYSHGFMPPKLDDLCKSGKIRKGFKLANPELKPEHLDNIEWGMTYKIGWFQIEPSVYYSLGHDLQYLVGTGDSVDTGSDDLKPVFQRRNISKVEVIGFEITAKYKIRSIEIKSHYTYNHSQIKEYERETETDSDLTGNYLIEVPAHQAYFGLVWKNKYFSLNPVLNYTGKIWYDDENTQEIDDYLIADVKLSKQLNKNWNLALDVHNIFDNEYVDRKGYLSPGRFIIFEAVYKFSISH